MGRSPSFAKYCGLKKKGKWTSEEDQKLVAYIEKHGHGSWSDLPDKAGLQRCGKSCRMRWINYLRPDVKRGKFSLQEEQTIIQLHALLGNRWSIIASHLSKRTDNEIKNYWNTHLKKRLTKLGINPMTHRPKTNLLGSAVDQSKDATNLSHMAQWESARLEAEARLGRESKKSLKKNLHHHNNPIGSTSAQLTATKKTSTMPRAKPQCLDVLKAWQGVVSGMFYFQTKADDNLDSPNSILNFSKNMAKNQNAVGLGNNTVGNQPIAMSHSVEERIFKENLLVDNPISLFQEITLTDGALLQESYNTKAENIVEGLSDIFAFDSSGERNLSISALDPDGLIDQDNNYWDVAMVDLVDISSGAWSPIY